MSATRLINYLCGNRDFDISNAAEKNGALYLLEIRIKNPDEITKFLYFAKRVSEHDESIIISVYADKLSFLFTEQGDEHYENLLQDFNKAYYLIEEPEKEDFTIIAKITARCNLSCQYCYDQEFRAALSHCGNLPLEDLDKLCNMASKYSRRVQLILHGGEPSLAGIPYFRSVLEDIVPKYPYCQFDVTMQSNGLILDEEWKAFMKEKDFKIGISYSALEPELRFTGDQAQNVLSNIKTLVKENVCSGIIDVITNTTIEGVQKIYEFYKEQSIPQNLNLVYAAPEVEDGMTLKSSETEKYYSAVSDYFANWVKESDAVPDRFASMYVERLLTGTGGTCSHHGVCIHGLWMGINANGDIYPCDGNYPRKYRIANIKEIESLTELYSIDNWQQYKNERLKAIDVCRETCKLYPYCNGGCPSNDIMATGSAAITDKNHCSIFFATMLAAYKALANVTIETVNPLLKKHILFNNCILPGEINDLLLYLDIDSNKLSYEFIETLNDKNFELFMILNHPKCEHRLQGVAWGMDSIPDDVIEDKRFETIKEKIREHKKRIILHGKEAAEDKILC